MPQSYQLYKYDAEEVCWVPYFAHWVGVHVYIVFFNDNNVGERQTKHSSYNKNYLFSHFLDLYKNPQNQYKLKL